MAALADQLLPGVGADLKGQHPAVHRRKLALGVNVHADGGGGQVGDVDVGAHAALPFLQAGGDGVHGGLLHQGDHMGRGKHRQRAAAHVRRSIPRGDHGFRMALEAGLQFRHFSAALMTSASRWTPSTMRSSGMQE